ncbi:hypothetical protein KFE25_013359 [Diacronema lutheri]|uniref:JmjC domain-containing protein n=1 Tax=Diacronema lutheri TaxID=2081491 RepID=A0A8J6CEM8_DIALT|nr:hypothetical protein KFE25_013359 [Diacronema lutheri]
MESAGREIRHGDVAACRLRAVEKAAAWLAAESRALWVPAHVPCLNGAPPPLAFLREHVLMSAPCIVRGAMDGAEWARARELWSLEYLSAAMGALPVTVNVTPHGRGDAVVGGTATRGLVIGGAFAKPEEREMTFAQFADALRKGAHGAGGVHYLSLQDGNLRAQHAPIAADVPAAVGWFADAVGCAPDAINLWVGDSDAVSSVHADHYENLYCVLSGEKVFTLLPPVDPISRDLEPRAPARYTQARGHAAARWELAPELAPDGSALPPVPWIGLDPTVPDQLPEQSAAVTVRVRAGEMLFLPANWYHRVTQSELTIAVNFWHDPIQATVPPAQLLAQFARKVHRALHAGELDVAALADTG